LQSSSRVHTSAIIFIFLEFANYLLKKTN
jgi:hypothetical protein